MTQPAARTSWPLFQLVALLPQLRRAAAGLAFLCMLSGTLALVGCQSTAKPGTSAVVDMSGGDNDSGMMLSCENMKCQNPDSKCCDGEPCVDVLTNTAHCGACGKTCRSREVCNNGNCACRSNGSEATCATDQLCCSDGCRQVMTDVRNCGGCNLPCKMGESCQGGKCSCGPSGIACRSGQICCGAGCSDLQNDPANCGACGKACAAGKACKNGLCEGECVSCAMGETCCNGACVNLLNDNKNCGMCGKVCPLVFGVPLPCILTICAFSGQDMGDMSMPTD